MATRYIKEFVKGSGEVLDYLFRFTNRLIADGNDTLVSPATITISGSDSVLTLDSQAVAPSSGVTVWLSSGTDLCDYLVTCEVDTAGGRTYVRSIRVKVRD